MKNVCFVVMLFCVSTSVYGKSFPFSFEENRGQAPAEARFLAHGQGYDVAFTPAGNRLALRRGGRVFSLITHLEGGHPKAVTGEQRLAGKVNYFRGSLSLTGIPTYSKIRYERVYAGIDLVYYGNERQLEYDFVVNPGADPKQIAMRFEGVESATIDTAGNLILRANGSEVVQHRPVLYQRIGKSRKTIDGAYRLLGPNLVAFDVGSYDRNVTLVIDPILSYSTFFGGTNGDDDAHAVTLDSSGNLYVVGSTTSTNIQTTFAIQPAPNNLDPTVSDAFIMKLNPAGTALIYSTYFGGTSDDDANDIAVDSSGSATVVGTTSSPDFPTTQGALRRTCSFGTGGCVDVFVARLTPAGTGLVYSTYLGGTGDDIARGVGVDSFGNAYVAGKTDSTDFPTTFGAYSTDPLAGGFVTKLTTGGLIAYSTYFSTIFGPSDPRGIAVDAQGNAYIAGSMSAGTTTGVDVFIAKLLTSGGAIQYSQFIRGAKDDIANAIAIDSGGNVYVTGLTSSINFPITTNAVQTRFNGGPAFRTGDGGSTWNIASTGITRTSLYALAIASGPNPAIYAGADDESVGGLFKSTDDGNTWSIASTGISDSRIHALAVDPSTPATVYAGTRTIGVFKSTTSGASWSPTSLNNVFVTALAIDPTVSTTIYAGTDASGIYKTTNGGAGWSSIINGLASGAAVRSIVVDPTANNTVYAATSVGIYKSTNGGGTWVPASSGLFDSNINVLAIDPANPSRLFAGTSTVGIFRSTNGGGLWQPANGGLSTPSAGLSVTAITIDASGTLYAAAGEQNALRIYKSSNGTSWTATGLASTRVTGLVTDRNNAGTVYAATVGGTDAFVAKWNASGGLVYLTFLGGSRDDAGNAIAADSIGGMYVAGTTSSTNFPRVNGFQSAFGGGAESVTDAFAAKVNAQGSDLDFSTYLGGSSNDFGNDIAVDASNTAYVVGSTASADFPTSAALNGSRFGLVDAFIVKIGEGSAISFAAPIRGGFSALSQGTSASPTVGYGRISQTSGGSNVSGLAIFGFRQNNVLVSEAAVPASTAITNGRIYAEVGGDVNTGLAIANPNGSAVTVAFYFTDRNGQNSGQGSTTIAANGQIARFLNQDPFNGGSAVFGTFTFSATQPVAVIALRQLSNERGESLITTLPVSDLSQSPDSDVLLFAHYADGGGWTTQFLLVNTTETAMAGTILIAGLGSQDYNIPARSSARLSTPGTASGTLTGLARVTPAAGNKTPVGLAVFSFKKGGITVTEAGVQALRPATAFRLYAEGSGTLGQNGFIQTGIALANPSGSSTQVLFEVTTVTGVSTGINGSLVLPGNGQIALFLGEISGLGNLPNPFQAIVRISTTSAGGISVVGLRGRYNERTDFLLTTTQPTIESAPPSSAEQFFPHFVDGGGYTTQFILYNGSTDQSSSGLIRFFGQTGQSLSLAVR